MVLLNPFKGIHKPARCSYAVTVSIKNEEQYADSVQIAPNTQLWRVHYAYERGDKNSYANRALRQCFRDSVPVAVLRKVKLSEPVRYEVLGVARVIADLIDSSTFLLEKATEPISNSDVTNNAWRQIVKEPVATKNTREQKSASHARLKRKVKEAFRETVKGSMKRETIIRTVIHSLGMAQLRGRSRRALEVRINRAIGSLQTEKPPKLRLSASGEWVTSLEPKAVKARRIGSSHSTVEETEISTSSSHTGYEFLRTIYDRITTVSFTCRNCQIEITTAYLIPEDTCPHCQATFL